MPLTTNEMFFNQELQFVDTGSSSIAYRKFGQGPAILFIHGWPFQSYTYRNLVPELQNDFTCYLLDLPGTGETIWRDQTDFTFPGQAKNLKTMVSRLGIEEYYVVAHNTGASIARHLAMFDESHLKKLAMFNTEIPGHRPPWIPFYRNLMFVPGANYLLRLLLGSDLFLHSSLGFGECYEDSKLIDGDFKKYMIGPVAKSPKKIEGLNLYLRGLNWALIDEFARTHANIKMPVLFIWGQNDPTFPEQLGRAMVEQFPNCVGFESISKTKLLLYEEKPDEVSYYLKQFFLS